MSVATRVLRQSGASHRDVPVVRRSVARTARTVAAAAAPGPLPAKLPIGAVNDPLERDTDRAADAAMHGEAVGSLASAPAAAQRLCAGCGAEAMEEPPVRRKCETCERPEASGNDGGETAADAVAAGGTPLSPELRRFFEPRFGRDFSDVRVHTDSRASGAGAAIGARAYTVGRDIGFAAREYAPHMTGGLRLIAHELAHTVQQPPFVARQAVPFYRQRFRERGGGGTTDFEETVQVAPTGGTGGIEGSVDRSVIAPAVGSQPEQQIHQGRVRSIRLTPDCRLVVPLRFRFETAPAAAQTDICQDPPSTTPVTPVGAAALNSLAARYVATINEALNGWYSARVEGCGQPCANRSIPILIEASAVATGGDIPIHVVNRGGRADSETICARSYNSDLAPHEGGHQVLGAPDEYRETDPNLRRLFPQLRRDERERRDLSVMGDHYDYGRFALYHERHFRFAQVFLEAVYRGQGCAVSLVAGRTPRIDFRASFGAGMTFGGGRQLTSVTGVLGVGFALERQRRLMAEVGVQGQLLSARGLDQDAFMIGLRGGLEARTAPANFGATANLFGSAGVLHRPETRLDSGPTLPARTGGYGEVGLGVGIHSGMGSGSNWHLRAEGALGAEIASDPRALRFARLGFSIGASF
jgi:hypothetical protein